ncbi:putative member of the PurR regulon [Halorhabdus sp. SVX81]|uniref:queuosine precursor transporter n=1 Tax=Halorhabdus sp. SVX81 TaxID=2978283 RepID=UPI0023DA7635|nr:queuosine precursor transporter [Halorhabdus sp. SVX81]WEL16756.1 putative member of the PurR regulon [Halorhabdus sp. SVX81]
MSAERSAPPLPLARLGLIAVFVTALITSQVTASKLVGIEIPFSLPLRGSTLIVPAAAFAYAVTFFASDCYAELYGRSEATKLVNVAFAMNFVLLGLVWLAIEAPIFVGSPVDQSPFASVLGSSTGVVAGSMLAYLVSQNLDVFTFHWLRDRTDGRLLWLRNVGSTATSQFVDTVIFITVAFILFKGIPLGDAAGLIVGQYLVKIGVAVFDTPFVYAVVHFVRDREVGPNVVPSD